LGSRSVVRFVFRFREPVSDTGSFASSFRLSRRFFEGDHAHGRY